MPEFVHFEYASPEIQAVANLTAVRPSWSLTNRWPLYYLLKDITWQNRREYRKRIAYRDVESALNRMQAAKGTPAYGSRCKEWGMTIRIYNKTLIE